ncbi:MAG: energy-coupled thiamine transporter ThiT [Christensenellales bacterium]|jgi:thiamine transporter
MEEQKTIFSEFLGMSTPALISLIVLAVLAVGAILYFSRRKTVGAAPAITTKMLVYGAMCIAIAFVLSFIRLYRMPQGGSLTPASMLPIMAYAYIFGPVPGLICGVAYGFLQLLQDLFVVHPVQLLLDYPLAFGLIGLAGFFRKNLIPGVIVGGFARIFMHILSGILFFAEYAPEGQSVVVYSTVYNLTVFIPDLAICVVIALIPAIKNMFNNIKASAAIK